MKILHIIGGFAERYGGIARAVHGLSEAEAHLGHEVTVIAATERGEEGEVLRPEGVKVIMSLQDPLSKFWPAYSVELKDDIVRNIQTADIAHIHGIWSYPSFLCSQIAYRANIPHIIAPQGSLAPWCLNLKGKKKRVYMSLIQKRQLLRANIIHAVCEDEARDIENVVGTADICVVPNGVAMDIGNISESEKKKYFEEYPYLRDRPYILFLGRLHPKKGIDLLIKAFSEVWREYKDHALVVAGPDEIGWMSELQKMANEAGIGERVFFPGLVTGTNKKCMLTKAEIYVLPSHSEGFSLGILEAMACSKPVIITKGCGFHEVAERGAGIIISPNVEELSQALGSLLSNTERLGDMGRKGRMLVEEKYSWEKIVEKTINMYDRAMSMR